MTPRSSAAPTKMPPATETLQSRAIQIKGMVQGVGFRPYVYRLAHALGLSGTVANSGDGVEIMATGRAAAMASFIQRLPREAPPMARISSLSVTERPQQDAQPRFTIIASAHNHKATVQITPDTATCPDCLREILDPSDRRHGYPFTNCTNCGPRFTIIKEVPYDRPLTSMAAFRQCRRCAAEYNDPLDRRFHAQPNACPECGPQLSWHDQQGRLIPEEKSLDAAARALAAGRILAIKGLGGFHLAVDATSTEAVERLRRAKKRPDKPLAIMVASTELAARYCRISATEQTLLNSAQRPIVLLEKKVRYPTTVPLADNLARGLGVLGVMLPYTPLHALLLNNPAAPPALVMTSGNLGGEPICTGNQEALERLSGLADHFLLHNRDIITRVDDSVARVMNQRPRLLRRARGYAPAPLPLAAATGDILACGGAMKNSFCIVRDNQAYLSQHIGELTSPACLDFYTQSIAHLQAVLECTPPAVACDLHPDYASSRHAATLQLKPHLIQHHHAHTAAVMAEHGLDSRVFSIILDGTGLGHDQTIFGGELYLADRRHYQRQGHLSLFRLPGGDKAAQEPWRMGLALLHSANKLSFDAEEELPTPLRGIPREHRRILGQMLERRINSPLSSSCGRLFDGVAAMLGLCLEASYEGQAAMTMEARAARFAAGQPRRTEQADRAYPVEISPGPPPLMLETGSLVNQILADLEASLSLDEICYRFHGWLIRGFCRLLEQASRETDPESPRQVVLSGGCLQNKILLEGFTARLGRLGFTVYSGEAVPVNDGGLSLGQAYIAAAP
ncbi:carbamoyltransferase HypF [Desulfogranum mediterraneum]|uniref:carbamoyltransferase HypF n=1 Tax=Desulfogranum mediterraneum TaxID=160661 RepID=UPI000415FECE|nr:carbamoyltransferase HypF [Desulfogranum mediterraneum]